MGSYKEFSPNVPEEWRTNIAIYPSVDTLSSIAFIHEERIDPSHSSTRKNIPFDVSYESFLADLLGEERAKTMSTRQIILWLSQSNVPFQVITHSPIISCESGVPFRGDHDLSHTLKCLVGVQSEETKGWHDKSIYGAGNSKYVLMVVPGNSKRVNISAINRPYPTTAYELASIDVIPKLFAGTPRGGVSPFGGIFETRTFVDSSLTELAEKGEKVSLNAGRPDVSIIMNAADYLEVEQPILIDNLGGLDSQ